MEFAYCRVGRGVPSPPSTDADGIDVRWETNRDAALAAGLKVGGYWRFYPASDPDLQVDRFCARLNSTTLPPMVDVEDQQSLSPSLLTDWTIDILEAVRMRSGRVPLLYTYRWFLSDALDAGRLLPRWPLGLAAWTDTDDWPDERATLWQYTGGTAVPWAAGNIDLDRMREV